MIDFFVEPLAFGFMQRALLAAGLASIVCAVVGTFVVLKGMAFMGDAVAHSSLTGMAVAFLLGGNVLGASWNEVALIGIIAGLVILVVGLFYKELLFTSYDATMAAASGIPVRLIYYLLPVLVAVTTVASLKAVGIVLVLALLVTPAATGNLLARRLPAIMATSVAVGLLSIVVGLYLSFYLDLPTGPSIAMVATSLFALALLFSPEKGLIRRKSKLAPVPSAENSN